MRYPVVLVHGIGAQGKYWYFNKDNSWAYAFADEGFDVFVPDLRGVGRSGGRMNFSFDDYIHDVFAIIDKVCSIEGVDKVHWVGHSMGGMIMYLAVTRNPEVSGRLASFVAVSSPFKIWNPFDIWWKFLKPHFEDISGFLKKVDNVPFSTFAQIFWFIFPIVDWRWGWVFSLEHVVWNPENVDKETRRSALLATGNISSRVLEKFFRVGFGEESFGFNLEKLEVPSLFIVGVKDYLASPPSVKLAYINSGSQNKLFIIAGVGEGFKADYGHVDINISSISREDVFRVVLDFITDAEMGEVGKDVNKDRGSRGIVAHKEVREGKLGRGLTHAHKPVSFHKKEYEKSKYSFLLLQDFGLGQDVWDDFARALDKRRISYVMPNAVLSPAGINELIDYFCASLTSTFNIGVFHGVAGLVATKSEENCFSVVFLIGTPITEISTLYSLYLRGGGEISPDTKLSIFLGKDDDFQLNFSSFTPLELDDIFLSPFNFRSGQLVYYILSTGDRATWWWNIVDFLSLSDAYDIKSRYLIVSYANMKEDLSHIGLIRDKGAKKYVIPFIIGQIESLKK